MIQKVTSNDEDALAAMLMLDKTAQEHGNIVPKVWLYSEFEKIEMTSFERHFIFVANDCRQYGTPLEFTLLPIECILGSLHGSDFGVSFLELTFVFFEEISQAIVENVLRVLHDIVLTRSQLIEYDAENLLRIERSA